MSGKHTDRSPSWLFAAALSVGCGIFGDLDGLTYTQRCRSDSDCSGGVCRFTAPQVVVIEGLEGRSIPAAAIAADERTLYFALDRLDAPSGVQQDLYRAERSVRDRGRFENPQLLPINVDGRLNGAPFPSADGRELYFFSDRQTPRERDLYVARRPSPQEDFGDAVALTELNSPQNDHLATLSYDGLTLFWVSERESVAGIWMAKRSELGAPFESPERLPPPIASGNGEGRAQLSRDGSRLYFTSRRRAPSEREGSRAQETLEDVWVATRLSPSEPFGEPLRIDAVSSPIVEQNVALAAAEDELFFTTRFAADITSNPALVGDNLYELRRSERRCEASP